MFRLIKNEDTLSLVLQHDIVLSIPKEEKTLTVVDMVDRLRIYIKERIVEIKSEMIKVMHIRDKDMFINKVEKLQEETDTLIYWTEETEFFLSICTE